jgi:hypothetical protein
MNFDTMRIPAAKGEEAPPRPAEKPVGARLARMFASSVPDRTAVAEYP